MSSNNTQIVPPNSLKRERVEEEEFNPENAPKEAKVDEAEFNKMFSMALSGGAKRRSSEAERPKTDYSKFKVTKKISTSAPEPPQADEKTCCALNSPSIPRSSSCSTAPLTMLIKFTNSDGSKALEINCEVISSLASSSSIASISAEIEQWTAAAVDAPSAQPVAPVVPEDPKTSKVSRAPKKPPAPMMAKIRRILKNRNF